MLVITLAFIAFFGLVMAGLLSYAGATHLQQVNTERTAAADASAEGGAAFAAADAIRSGATCRPNDTGSLTMQGGDVVGYTVKTCNPGTSANQGLASDCILCLLSQAISPPAPPVFSQNNGNLQVNGPVAINGTGVSGGGTLTAVGSPPFIGCAASCIGSGFQPPSAMHTISAIADPLASLPAPAASGPCAQVTAVPQTLPPGVYCSIDWSQPGTYTLSGGTYVITGRFTVSGQASVVSGGGVVVYFTCGSGTSVVPCAAGGQAGGAFDASGGDLSSTNLAPQATGTYQGIVMMFDRNDTGSTATSCASRDVPTVALCLSGHGTTIGGTIYGRSAPVDVQGSARGAVITGQLVAASLAINVNGMNGAGLNLTGAPTSALCSVSDDSVTGTAGLSSSTGHVVVETSCNGGSGLVDFDYLP